MFLAQQSTTAESLLPGALLAFALVAPFYGLGIYFYIRDVQAEDADSPSGVEMVDHLRLFDTVRQRGYMSLDELADAMQTDRQTIQQVLQEMVTLNIFSGYYDPQQERLYAADNTDLLTLTHCRICGEPLHPVPQQVTTCPTCQSDYFLI